MTLKIENWMLSKRGEDGVSQKKSEKKAIKDLTKKGQLEPLAIEPKQFVFRIESLIFLVIVVMILVILFLVMPVLLRAGRNNLRQHDIGLVAAKLQEHYQQTQQAAELEDLVDEEKRFRDTESADLHVYGAALFHNFEQQLKTDRSYYSSERADFTGESFLPDTQNIHIWYGYRCETPVDIVLASNQIKYKALRGLMKVDDEPSYVILYKLEKRRSTYRCAAVDLSNN